MMKVLVIDDDREVEQIISTTCETRGVDANVLSAFDGTEGLSIAKAEEPDLIMLNIRLNGTNSFTICREIRKFSTIPIIMLTNNDSDNEIVHAFEAGADDYVKKPFSHEYLCVLIRAIMRRTQWQFI